MSPPSRVLWANHLATLFLRCLVVCCGRGSCREAGNRAGEPRDLPTCAPRNFGPQRGAGTPCGSTVARPSILRRHPQPRENDFGAARVAQRRESRVPGSQFPGRSAGPRRQGGALGSRVRPLSRPLATFAFPRGKLASRVPVAMGRGRGRRDPELIGSRLLGDRAHESPGGGEDGRATAVSAQQMPPLRSPTQMPPL